MKLFVEKIEKIDGKYIDELTLSHAEVVDEESLSIKMDSESTFHADLRIDNIKFFDTLIDGDPFLLEFQIVINQTNSDKNVLELEYGSTTVIIFDTNVSTDIKTKIPLIYQASENHLIDFSLDADVDPYSITISAISIKRPTLFPIPIMNSKEIQINKQVKNFDNITDIKASYTNNIKLKYTPEIITNFGYFNEISSTEIFNKLNGTRAILTTDDAYYIADGKISIQQIVKLQENYVIDLFFTSYESSFFHQLSANNLEVPHLWCENTLSDRQENFQKKSVELNDDYNYSYIFDEYNFYNNSIINNYEIHSGYFDLSIVDFTDDNADEGYNKVNDEMPIQLGYSAMPALAEPVFKHKFILENLHKKYGYIVDTELFNDPKYNLLHISPKKNEIKETVSINDMSYSGSMSLNNKNNTEATIWMNPTTYDSTYFSGVTTDISTYSTQYEVLNSVYNDYEKMYGSFVDDDFKHLRPRKNMRLSADAQLILTIYKEDSAPTNIRVMILDNVGDFSESRLQMNPYTTYIIKDIVVEATTQRHSSFVIDFKLKDLYYKEGVNNNIGYGYRVVILTDATQPTRDPIFSASATLDLTNIEIYENNVLDNSYWMNDEMSFSMSEKNFIRDFITKFNLIPEIDYINKIVHYYPFDDFYRDGELLDWSSVVDRNKELLYLYGKNNSPTNYKFSNNTVKTSKSEEEFEEVNNNKYSELNISSIYNNSTTQKINNLIGNIFFTEENKLMYGLYNDGDPDDFGGFPLQVINTVFLRQQTFELRDKKSLDSKHYRFNEQSNRSKTIMGYINSVPGKAQIINSHTITGVPWVTTGLFAYGPIFRDDTTGLESTYNHITLQPKYLAPFNKIDSDDFEVTSYTNNNFYNSLVYDDSINSTINLYTEYEREINNFTLSTNNIDNHLLECYVVLGIEEYSNLKLNETIKLDNRFYIIRKISNFLDKKPTKVTLMSWRYNPNSYTYVYKDPTSYPVVIGLTDKLDLSTEGKIVFKDTTEQTIGFFTNHHEVGKTYKVKFTWTAYGDDVDFEGYSKNGENDFVTLHDGSETVEYTYTRTSSNYAYPNLETIKMKASSIGAYITYNFEISEI